REALVLRGVALEGRGEFDLFIRELAEAGAVAVGDVEIGGIVFLLGVAFPLENDALAVAGPPYTLGLEADESGPAHDVVDGEGEFLCRPGLGNEEDKDQKLAH